ncbi:hypothetical protein KC333_g8576 [Hortaea werneckii]|nr:hypothetical protein KC333_g8576 [Hortaea werneckii]KAI7303778.1 hypothetical protein KC326_g8608 [Hortaea werneckii]
MPPRIPSSRIPQPQTCQCYLTRTTSEPVVAARQFHASARHDTRLRRNMWEWLKGPGKVFRDPLPGSTNYLSAYDKSGNLLRARRNQSKDDQSRDELDEDEDTIVQRELDQGLDDVEREDRALSRATRRAEREEADARGGIPPERLGDMRPYPLNQSFRSQPVLSEELREQLYIQVVNYKHDIPSVAATFGVDVRRVAAVIRLKTIEKQWEEEGKRLATPYAQAVLNMLPTTPFKPDTAKPITVHEPINDLPVHPRTRQQLFYPASESRHFTREDAAKAFDNKLLPADKRIPLPMLVDLEKWKIQGLSREERQKKQREMDDAARTATETAERKQAEWEARTQRTVPGRRWDFKFQDISAEKVGKDGRGKDAVGYRYGMPHEDRKRGMVKIPTRVE